MHVTLNASFETQVDRHFDFCHLERENYNDFGVHLAILWTVITHLGVVTKLLRCAHKCIVNKLKCQKEQHAS